MTELVQAPIGMSVMIGARHDRAMRRSARPWERHAESTIGPCDRPFAPARRAPRPTQAMRRVAQRRDRHVHGSPSIAWLGHNRLASGSHSRRRSHESATRFVGAQRCLGRSQAARGWHLVEPRLWFAQGPALRRRPESRDEQRGDAVDDQSRSDVLTLRSNLMMRASTAPRIPCVLR
jgi:hypothetical protein